MNEEPIKEVKEILKDSKETVKDSKETLKEVKDETLSAAKDTKGWSPERRAKQAEEMRKRHEAGKTKKPKEPIVSGEILETDETEEPQKESSHIGYYLSCLIVLILTIAGVIIFLIKTGTIKGKPPEGGADIPDDFMSVKT